MNMILMSFLAGALGMGFGALITAVFGCRTDRLISIFLSFAGGVMISIVFLELVPEAIDLSNVLITTIGLIAGAIMIYVFNQLMDRFPKKKKGSQFHETFTEFFHSGDMVAKKSSLLRSGIIMLIAIGLHNIPEGLAMGAAGQHDATLGLALAIVIGLHSIPEGMAVSAPLIAGGLPRIKSVVMTFLVGATTIIGAIAGVIIGGISDTAVAISISIAGGAMLYVVIGEILPQSIVTSKDRLPTIFVLVGIIVGMLFIELVH